MNGVAGHLKNVQVPEGTTRHLRGTKYPVCKVVGKTKLKVLTIFLPYLSRNENCELLPTKRRVRAGRNLISKADQGTRSQAKERAR
jgi:hypothetical protein